MKQFNKEDLNQLQKYDDAEEKRKRQLKQKVIVRNIVIVILIEVIIILLLKGCDKNSDLLINKVFNQETSEYQENEAGEIPHIDIPVIIDTTLTKDSPYMSFYNPETNADKFYLKYELHSREDDSIIWESDMVEPGQKFSADIYSELNEVSGAYYCYIKVRTFEFDSLEEKNGTSNNIIIIIK